MSEIFIFIFGVGLGGGAVWFFNRKQMESLLDNQEQLKDAFGNLSKEALDANLDSFLKLAESKFSDLVGKSGEQLGKKKELIDSTLKEMKSDLKSLSDNTIALKSQMEESRKSVGELSDTTSQLRQILSSSQARGQWGERMVKDILDFIGLVEGINYTEQSQVADGTERPDFTFFLPDDKTLNMDVKFPLASYERYINSELEEEQEGHKKDFLRDVKIHIKAIAGRAYINPAEGTLDYVLMFIPNESIYGFINQEDTQLIDYALGKKVLLCSPLTLYAMLSLIYQATRNFAMEEKATEVMNLLNSFRLQWDKYVEVMDKMGRSLDTAKKDYDTMVGTRKNQLEKPLSKIEEITSGGEVGELVE